MEFDPYDDPWHKAPELIGSDYDTQRTQIFLWFAEHSIDYWFPISTLVVVGPYAFDLTLQKISSKNDILDPLDHGFPKFSELVFAYRKVIEGEIKSPCDHAFLVF